MSIPELNCVIVCDLWIWDFEYIKIYVNIYGHMLCSFLWSCSAPSYGIAFGKSRVWFAVLFKYFMKNTDFKKTSADFMNISEYFMKIVHILNKYT